MAVSKFSSSAGSNDFNINVGSLYSVVNFTQEYASGSYSFTSAQLDVTMDVYVYNAQGTLVGYTNGKGLTTSGGFIKMVILGGTVGDVLSFSYKTTYYGIAETNEVLAGPAVVSTTPTVLASINATTVVTGVNFATDVAATFTGSDNLVRVAKSVVRGSVNSLVVTRPDSFPIAYSPYTLTVTNPSVAYQPTGSAVNIITVTAGILPTWNTAASQTNFVGLPLATLSATKTDSGATISSYAVVSGAFPTGVTFNTSTGAFTGLPTNGGTYNVTVRATDSGGNFADRAFTYTVGSGVLTSDATYYYLAITGNATLGLGQSLTADIVAVGGGGAATSYSGGGGGAEVIYMPAKTLTAGSYPIVIGSGGTGNGNNAFNSAQHGSATTCFGETVKPGGGAKSSDDTSPTSTVTDRGPLSTFGNGGGGSSRSAGYGGTVGTSVGAGITRYGGYYGGNNIGGGSAPTNNGNYTGGGGGGAGGDGDNGQNDAYNAQGNVKGGNGGPGVSALGYYWAGGGGGGIYYQNTGTPKAGNGGIGGGGAGGCTSTASFGGGSAYNAGGNNNSGNAGGSGGANTGGGGGAGRGEVSALGGNGGSGIVYLRFTRSQVGG